MTKDKSRIQSCVDHINTAVDVDPWAKELVAEMRKEALKQLNNSNNQLNNSTQEVKNSNDAIGRQALISTILGMTTFGNVHELNKFVHKCHLDGERMGGLRDAVFAIVNAPSVQPTYTDEQIQKMQEMEQAQLEKAFDLGREDAKAEIVRCKDCKFWTHNEELTPEEAASEIASGSTMSAWYWLDDMIRLKQMGYAICRKENR